MEAIFESQILALIVFGFFAMASISGAVYLLVTKNILYGAYGFLVSLLGVAGIFLLAGAEFIAVSQIMIYVGGVLVLILFGIMLSAKGKKKSEALLVVNGPISISVLLTLLIIGGLSTLALNLRSPRLPSFDNELNQINGLGMTLMTTHVLILEMVGVLLLVVLIGASYIAKTTEK